MWNPINIWNNNTRRGQQNALAQQTQNRSNIAATLPQYTMNIQPRPTHGQSDSIIQDKIRHLTTHFTVICQFLNTTVLSNLTSWKFHTSTPKRTSHQHWSLLPTTQEAASYHTPLKIWDNAPTPLLAIISTTERRVQPTDIWTTSNIYLTRTSHQPNSEFELPTIEGTHHPHQIKRLLIHRDFPNPRP